MSHCWPRAVARQDSASSGLPGVLQRTPASPLGQRARLLAMTGVERLEARQVCGHRIAIAMHEVAGPSTVIF